MNSAEGVSCSAYITESEVRNSRSSICVIVGALSGAYGKSIGGVGHNNLAGCAKLVFGAHAESPRARGASALEEEEGLCCRRGADFDTFGTLHPIATGWEIELTADLR